MKIILFLAVGVVVGYLFGIRNIPICVELEKIEYATESRTTRIDFGQYASLFVCAK